MSDERDLQRKDRQTYRLAGLGNRSFTAATNTIGHVDDQVAGYVLGALEANEVALVDAHVRTCPGCERSLAEAQRTASMLPFVVPMHKPPIDSKVALLARVAGFRSCKHQRGLVEGSARRPAGLRPLRSSGRISSGGRR